MEKLLKKYIKFQWNEECPKSLNTLKENIVSASILAFPDWCKEFHVHVDASLVSLGAVLAQACEGSINHLIIFSSRKLSTAKNNYTTTKRGGLAMVYALHKF